MQGEVCGLCGDFDGNGQNDFTTQSHLVVSSVLEFANSWKRPSNCPDVESNIDPCVSTPNRQHWARMMCSIITGDTFKQCHSKVRMGGHIYVVVGVAFTILFLFFLSLKVDPRPFYDNCVKDSCACDSGGDCECFCTAVAAYAQACNEAGECVSWRTPEICRK